MEAKYMNDIYLGDSYEMIKEIPDKSIDLIVTDPPYNIGECSGKGILKNRSASYFQEIRDLGINKGIDYKILDEFVRVMKKINIYIWCNKAQLLDYLKYFVDKKKCNFDMIIWAKNNPPPFLNGHYLKDKEYCLFFWESGVKPTITYNRGKTVYFSNLNVKDKKLYHHPTIKPEEIISNLILNSSEEGGVILDTFSGSGTTCVCAKKLHRNYIGFEINKEYYEISRRRLNENEQLSLFD